MTKGVGATEFALPLNLDASVTALRDAAGRLGLALSFKPDGCGRSGDNCRFSVGAGVVLTVTARGGPKVYQLEASWNNGSAESDASSRSRFSALCASVVATVEPNWSKAEVQRIVSKIAILRPIKGDSLDVDERRGPIHFYGAKNIPAMPGFPSEAFLQCGASPNDE